MHDPADRPDTGPDPGTDSGFGGATGGDGPAEHDGPLTTADERAAMRAFLQRCEVRLSTMHRTATALLSGAGILVLLPAVERDSVLSVLRALLVGPLRWSRVLLALGVITSIVLALVVLWYVLVELTRFYFHANHVEHAEGTSFTPRFTLTSLRLPSDELGAPAGADYDQAHTAAHNVRLLVPANPRARQRIDRQLAAYPTLLEAGRANSDLARAEGLFELAAARRRTLIDEVAKVEYGMARHMLRLQVIVLRYVKALLVVITTALSTFACAAAINSATVASAPDQRWIAGALLAWAPLAMFTVSAPVLWLETLLRSEGAGHTALRRDRELVRLEDTTAKIATVTWGGAVVAMIVLLVHHPVTTAGRVACLVTLSVSALSCGLLAVRRWRATRLD